MGFSNVYDGGELGVSGGERVVEAAKSISRQLANKPFVWTNLTSLTLANAINANAYSRCSAVLHSGDFALYDKPRDCTNVFFNSAAAGSLRDKLKQKSVPYISTHWSAHDIPSQLSDLPEFDKIIQHPVDQDTADIMREEIRLRMGEAMVAAFKMQGAYSNATGDEIHQAVLDTFLDCKDSTWVGKSRADKYEGEACTPKGVSVSDDWVAICYNPTTNTVGDLATVLRQVTYLPISRVGEEVWIDPRSDVYLAAGGTRTELESVWASALRRHLERGGDTAIVDGALATEWSAFAGGVEKVLTKTSQTIASTVGFEDDPTSQKNLTSISVAIDHLENGLMTNIVNEVRKTSTNQDAKESTVSC